MASAFPRPHWFPQGNPQGVHPGMGMCRQQQSMIRTIRTIGGFAALAVLSASVGAAQTDSFRKNFNLFKEVAPGIDFYAGSRSDTAPFERPLREAQKKVASLLNRKLARGVIVVCTTMQQKDSVQETRLLKLGYSWALIQLTPSAMIQQMMTELKARMGNTIPPGVLDMIQNRPPEQRAADDARMAGPMVQRVCFALLETTLMPERGFKSSRIDDLSRSPLADWLDVGVAWYASGAGLNLTYLQEHLDEVFPLEDMLSMPRPFVAPQSDGGSGAGTGVIRIAGAGSGPSASPGQGQTLPAPPGGAAPPAGAVVSGGGMGPVTIPKDVQDRLTFDSQAASFFSFIIEKLGIEKAKAVIEANLQGILTRDTLSLPDSLGPDMDQIENRWREWVKLQKTEEPMMLRIKSTPGKAPTSPRP